VSLTSSTIWQHEIGTQHSDLDTWTEAVTRATFIYATIMFFVGLIVLRLLKWYQGARKDENQYEVKHCNPTALVN